jgi:uroporphyrinogen decarboxylase
MNRRERVLTAIRHEEPDFVPYNFHAIGSVYSRVRKHYNLPNNDSVVEFVGNHVAKIGSDFNVNPWAKGVNMQAIPSGGPVTTAADTLGATHTDEFGCVWDRSKGLPHPIAYPLAENHNLLDSYEFPDPYREGRFEPARAMVDRYGGRVFLFGKLGMALFERAWSIRGMQQLLMDMVLRPEFVETLLDRILYEWNLPIIDQQLALGVDGFYFADDWGSKTSLMFSAAMWRRFIKPRLTVCYQRCKEANAFVGQHSDGNILEIFPDLIEIGLDIFNPVQPSVYDPNMVKEKYGDRVTLYGGIDVETTLPFGTPDEVRAAVRERAERLGKGGGYILQSSHTIIDDVPMENIVAYIEACHELAGIDTEQAAERAREAASSS